jgi:hypothetical protein
MPWGNGVPLRERAGDRAAKEGVSKKERRENIHTKSV